MTDTAYIEKLYDIAQKSNNVIKSICPQAYAYLQWTPYLLGDNTPESAFTRDVVNYHALIKECLNYLWYSEDDKFLDYLDAQCNNSSYSLKNIKNGDFLRQLKDMRNFVCHRFDANNSTYIKSYCTYLGASIPSYGYTSDDDIAIFIEFDNWQDKRRQLFEDTMAIADVYYKILLNVSASNEAAQNVFTDQWKDAVAHWYSTKNGKLNELTGCLMQWKKFQISNGWSPQKIKTFLKPILKKYKDEKDDTIRKKQVSDVMKKELFTYDLHEMYTYYLNSEFTAFCK